MPEHQFTRLEMAMATRADILLASTEMRRLADELDSIAGVTTNENDAVVLAQHRVRRASKKLRGGNGQD